MDLWHIKHRKYFNRVNKRFMDKHDVYLQWIFDRKFFRAFLDACESNEEIYD